MVLISLLLDLIAFGGYFLVTANPNPPIFLLLSIVESVIVVLLIGFTFAYRGQRHSRFLMRQPERGHTRSASRSS